jgi:hypothetical protein
MTNVGIAPKVGAWQHARIVARADGTVEHWLNGVKVLEFNAARTTSGARRRQQVQVDAGFRRGAKGRILLQDHGDAVATAASRSARSDYSDSALAHPRPRLR